MDDIDHPPEEGRKSLKAWPPETPFQALLLLVGGGVTLTLAVLPLQLLNAMLFAIGSASDVITLLVTIHFLLFVTHTSWRLTSYAVVAAKTEWTKHKVDGAGDGTSGEPIAGGDEALNEGGNGENGDNDADEDQSQDGAVRKRRKKRKPSAKMLQQLAERQRQLQQAEAEMEMAKAEENGAMAAEMADIGSQWTGQHAVLMGRLTRPCPETGDVGRCVHADLNAAQIALFHGDIELAKELLNMDSSFLSANEDGTTILSLALEEGQTRFAQWLLTTSSLDANRIKAATRMADVIGETPLMAAARRGYVQVVALLSEMGVDAKQADNEGNTALILAAKSGNLSCVRQLARLLGPETATEANRTNFANETAMCAAATEGWQGMVHLLHELGARFGPSCEGHPGCPDFMCGDADCHVAHVKSDIKKVIAKEAKKCSRTCTWCGQRSKKSLEPCTKCSGVYYCDWQCRDADAQNHRHQCA